MVVKVESVKQKVEQAKGNTSCRCEPPESLPLYSRDSRGRPSKSGDTPEGARGVRRAGDAGECRSGPPGTGRSQSFFGELKTSHADPPSARRERGTRLVAELEELDGVVGPDLALILFWDVGVDLVDDRPRIGPFILDVREVGAEHEAGDTAMLSFIHRHTPILDGR